jgi:putative ABC transport system permease protein
MGRDISLAFRNLIRNKSFSALAIFILALGIGGATAVFSVVNTVLLKSLPYGNSQRIVTVTTGEKASLAGGDYMDLKEGVDAFESLGYYYGGQISVHTPSGASFAGASFASPEFFNILGIPYLLAGRTFTTGDNGALAVLTAEFAARNFVSPQQAIGQQIVLYGKPYSIIGVIPTEQQYPARNSVWVLAPPAPENQNRTAHLYKGVALLRNGQTAQSARAQLNAIAQRLAAQFPKSHGRKFFSATPLLESLVANSRETLYALLAAVLILLLIACANVANLLLAQGAARTREIAVRSALGAGSWPIVRMLLAESLALAIVSALAGLGIAFAGLRALVSLAPPNTPRLVEVAIDLPVLAFTALIVLFATATFGILPAVQALRIDLQSALKQAGGRGVIAGGGGRLRRALVVAEIALSFVLALSAGLIFKSFLKITETDLGFQPSGVLVAYAAAPANGTESSQVAAARWFTAISGKLAAIPGVDSASAAMGVPSGIYNAGGPFIVEGKQDWNDSRAGDLPQARLRLAGANYFHTIGIPLRAGRDFTDRDAFGAPHVAVISEGLARQQFPNEDPIGKRIQSILDNKNWMTIIGIVGDARSNSPTIDPMPEVYMPFQQHPAYADELQLVLRTRLDPASLTEPVRRLVQGERADVALRFQTLESMVGEAIALPRFRTTILGVFSLVAVLLALAGVYGVMAYIVEQRRNEFGIRLALGASGPDLARLTLSGALQIAALGILIGVGLSFLVQQSLSAFLYGIEPTDLATWAAAVAAMAAVAFLAAWLPARRAAAVNPAVVLRGD